MYVEALDEFVEAKQGNPNASTKQILNLCLAKQGNLNASTKQIMNLCLAKQSNLNASTKQIMNLCLLQTAQIRKHGYQVNCMKNICKFWIENWRDKKRKKIKIICWQCTTPPRHKFIQRWN